MTSTLRAIAKRLPSLTSNKNSESKVKPYHEIPTNRGCLPSSVSLILSGGPGYLHEHCEKRHKKLGPIYREYLGSNELVFLADTKLIQMVLAKEGPYPHHNVPEAWLHFNEVKNIKRGIFFQQGQSWERLRKNFNKVMLDSNNLSRFSDNILKINADLTDIWLKDSEAARENSFILNDVKLELDKWSIESTGFMLFGSRIGCIPTNGSPILDSKADELVKHVTNMFAETSKFQILPVKLAHKFKLKSWKKFEESSTKMIEIATCYAKHHITKIRNNENAPDSLLKDILTLDTLTDDEISRSLVDLIIAAADTTSNSLQWMLYLIAKRKDVQMKILTEVNPILGDPEGSKKLVQNAPYLRAFIREASRLYPTAPFLARTLEEDIKLDNYMVPAGTPIVFSLYTTSRSERYFNQALDFKPERWMRSEQLNGGVCPHRSERKHAYASLPFGFGARNCIGRRLAELEMFLFLASYVKQFESSLLDDENIGIKLKMISRPDKPINIRLRARS